MSILLTGATGHVGTAILPLLVEDDEVVALVRAEDDAHLAKRRAVLLERLGPDFPADRLRLVRGDVCEPGLGAAAGALDDIDAIVHSAASVRFDLPEAAAAKENVGSTVEVLALARRQLEKGRLTRYDHVSTSYVAGNRTGRVFEHEGDEGQGFRNSYEWSKCQAEKKVQEAGAAGLPFAIHRPSIIVGDSRTGATRSFNVLYWPLKLYARGWWRFFPGRPDTLVDVVPVDFVAGAIAQLRRDPTTLGETFHLAAGDAAARVDELVGDVATMMGRPPLRYVDQSVYVKWLRPVIAGPLSLHPKGRSILRGGKVFLPYFTGNPLFDTTNARAHLASPPPDVKAYLGRIVQFAIEKDFGGR